MNARHDCDPGDRDRRLHTCEYNLARIWGGLGDREEEPVILYFVITICKWIVIEPDGVLWWLSQVEQLPAGNSLIFTQTAEGDSGIKS